MLFVQRAPINWLVVVCELLAAASALVGIAALASAHRLPSAAAKRRQSATTQGVTLLALAALCALPILLGGRSAALLAPALGVVAFLLYGVEGVRPRIAPLDTLLAALGLGPGLFCLTILAQGQRFTRAEWLVAIALGGMTFAVVAGLSLRGAAAIDRSAMQAVEDVQAPRTLATVIGSRAASALIGLALLVSYAVVVIIAVPRGGWPGALLALTSAPLALVGFSGLAVSSYAPARRVAARQLLRAYLWYGLALAVGLTLTLIAQQIIQATVKTLGG
jgi:1,4-dihydroxy-2-naphthoate octaprenyltransferase